MKKYQVLTCAAIAGLWFILAGLEGGALSVGVGAPSSLVAGFTLLIALVKLDVFDFEEESILRKIELFIQAVPDLKGRVRPSCEQRQIKAYESAEGVWQKMPETVNGKWHVSS